MTSGAPAAKPEPDGDQKATAVPAAVPESVKQEPAVPEPEPAEPEMTEALPLDRRPCVGRYAYDPAMMAGRDGQGPPGRHFRDLPAPSVGLTHSRSPAGRGGGPAGLRLREVTAELTLGQNKIVTRLGPAR